MSDHESKVREQYDPVAHSYLASSVHAQGEDLRHVARTIEQCGMHNALDLGCGAGHMSFAIAPFVDSVIALDLSDSMLRVVRDTALQKGLNNILTDQSSVTSLSYPDKSFDLCVTRFSAHHWFDVKQALSEIRRVLKPSGLLFVIDIVAPDNPLLDTHLQAIELLRDPSHVRNYSVIQWRTMFKDADFAVDKEHGWTLRMDFQTWIERMRTAPVSVAAIEMLLKNCPEEFQQFLHLDTKLGFDLQAQCFQAYPVSG